MVQSRLSLGHQTYWFNFSKRECCWQPIRNDRQYIQIISRRLKFDYWLRHEGIDSKKNSKGERCRCKKPIFFALAYFCCTRKINWFPFGDRPYSFLITLGSFALLSLRELVFCFDRNTVLAVFLRLYDVFLSNHLWVLVRWSILDEFVSYRILNEDQV